MHKAVHKGMHKTMHTEPATMELIVTSLAVAYDPIPAATAALKSVSKVARAEVPVAMVLMSAAKVAVDVMVDLRHHRQLKVGVEVES